MPRNPLAVKLEKRSLELPPYERAAVLLLAQHGFWLRHQRFLDVSGLDAYAGGGEAINWAAAQAAFDAGEFDNVRPNDRSILDLALIWGTNRLRLGQLPAQHLGIIAMLQHLPMQTWPRGCPSNDRGR